MQFRRLGTSGLQISLAGLGCNNFGMILDAAGTEAVVHEALEQGITFFDTADIYGRGRSEEFLGQALGKRRQDVIIGTKFGMRSGEGPYHSGGSRHYVYKAVADSLRRLGTDYIDLYQFHQPDPSTPIEETLEALDDLVRQGTVRYLGSSNFSGWQIAEADWAARHHERQRFVCAQNEWNLLNRRLEREVIPACTRFGVGMLPYFPLASGLLTGKYQRGQAPPPGTRLALWGERMGDRVAAMLSDANFDRLDRLTAFAQQQGHTLLDLAHSWLASQPAVASVIAGATTPEQVRANVAAVNWTLSADEMGEVDTILRD